MFHFISFHNLMVCCETLITTGSVICCQAQITLMSSQNGFPSLPSHLMIVISDLKEDTSMCPFCSWSLSFCFLHSLLLCFDYIPSSHDRFCQACGFSTPFMNALLCVCTLFNSYEENVFVVLFTVKFPNRNSAYIHFDTWLCYISVLDPSTF